MPIFAIFGVTAAVGLTILLAGRKWAEASPVNEHLLPALEPESEFDGETNDSAEAQCCPSGSS